MGKMGYIEARKKSSGCGDPPSAPPMSHHRGQAQAVHFHQGTLRAQSLTVLCPHQPVGTTLPRTGHSVPLSSPSREPPEPELQVP